MYTSGLQGRGGREVRCVMRLTDFRLASIWDLFKNATHRSHLPTQKMLRTAGSGSAGPHLLKAGLVVSSDSDRDTRQWL